MPPAGLAGVEYLKPAGTDREEPHVAIANAVTARHHLVMIRELTGKTDSKLLPKGRSVSEALAVYVTLEVLYKRYVHDQERHSTNRKTLTNNSRCKTIREGLLCGFSR